jgi:hypothetical protein
MMKPKNGWQCKVRVNRWFVRCEGEDTAAMWTEPTYPSGFDTIKIENYLG